MKGVGVEEWYQVLIALQVQDPGVIPPLPCIIYVSICMCVYVCMYECMYACMYVLTCYVLTNPPIPSSPSKHFIKLRPNFFDITRELTQ